MLTLTVETRLYEALKSLPWILGSVAAGSVTDHKNSNKGLNFTIYSHNIMGDK